MTEHSGDQGALHLSQGSADLDHHQIHDFRRASSSRDSAAGEDFAEPGLSDDEDLAPDQPSFIGLFKPQVFRSLLHKAKIITGLGLKEPQPETSADPSIPSAALFTELAFEAEEIPGPKMFRDIIT